MKFQMIVRTKNGLTVESPVAEASITELTKTINQIEEIISNGKARFFTIGTVETSKEVTIIPIDCVEAIQFVKIKEENGKK